MYLDGIWLKRSWGGEVKNVAVLVAVGVDTDGYREMLVGGRLRHVAGTPWGTRPYMDMTRITEQETEAALSAASA